MVLEFHKLEYHGKLDFTTLEYPKSGRSLHIFKTVVDCNIVCKNVLFGYFCQYSLCAFALNLDVLVWLVGKTWALTMNVAGVVKDWLLIVFSWSVIKDTITPLNLFGYGLAFLGVAYYNHSKLQAFKVKKVQKKASQADEEQTTNLDSVLKKKKIKPRLIKINIPQPITNTTPTTQKSIQTKQLNP